ncbi:hypothetical protein EC96154_0915 [Escherichia coli 96.154]|nr:hypothetical protein EC96154_0915 [Escherichia coli 96.154]
MTPQEILYTQPLFIFTVYNNLTDVKRFFTFISLICLVLLRARIVNPRN